MFNVVVYEVSHAKLDFNHYIEVDRLSFETEEDAIAHCEDRGYLDHPYSVSIEDENGTVNYL